MNNSFLTDTFDFKTNKEIMKMIALRVKKIRKVNFKTQESFAKHIGMTHGSYARFEKSGEVSFSGFVAILKGIGYIDKLDELLKTENEVIKW
jgi:DNA-binding XRE family transcriptional regulator